MTVLKIALVVGLTLGALASSAGSWSHFLPFVDRRAGAPPIAGAVAGAFVAAFFSFGGWWEVMRIAGEVRDPQRTLPRALAFGLASVMLIYTAATLSFIYVIPIESVADGQGFVAQVGEAIVGPGGGAAVALIVIVCVLGSLGAMQMLAPRLYFAMAEDGLFPAAAAAVHPRFGTPARAIATQAVLARAARRARHVRHDRRLLRLHHGGVHRRDSRLGVRAADGGIRRSMCPAIPGRRWCSF